MFNGTKLDLSSDVDQDTERLVPMEEVWMGGGIWLSLFIKNVAHYPSH